MTAKFGTHNVQTVTFGSAARAGLVAGVVAAIPNIVIYYVAKLAAGASFIIRLPGEELPLPAFMVGLETVIPVLLGAIIYWVFTRLTRKAALPFQLVFGALALLSTVMPLLLPDADPGTKVGLALMHLTGTIAVVAIPRLAAAGK